MDATERFLKRAEYLCDPNRVFPSTEERKRSHELYEHRRCPNCDHQISIADVISMLFGNGWDRPVEVQHEDGSIEWVFATKANPQVVRVLGCFPSEP